MKTLKRSITVLVCLILFASCSVTKYKKLGSKIGLIQTNYWSGQLQSESYAKVDSINSWILSGLTEGYYKNGQLKYKGNIKDDEMNGLTEGYYKNGQLEYKGSYTNGIQSNICEFYYESGQLNERHHHKKSGNLGLKDGRSVTYFKNGKLKRKGNYVNDKKDGVWEFYKKNGKLKNKVNIKDGKEIY